jgi:hypothetical protein
MENSNQRYFFYQKVNQHCGIEQARSESKMHSDNNTDISDNNTDISDNYTDIKQAWSKIYTKERDFWIVGVLIRGNTPSLTLAFPR